MAGSNINMNSLGLHRKKLFNTDRMKRLEIQSMDIQTAETVGKANSVIYDACTHVDFTGRVQETRAGRWQLVEQDFYLLVHAVERSGGSTTEFLI
jgi:hypothetical protein